MSIKNVLVFGKDPNELTKALGITGEEANELMTISLDTDELYEKILKELKKLNIHLESMTGNQITNPDTESYKKEIIV